MNLRNYLLILLIFTCVILVSCSNNGKGKNVIDENPMTPEPAAKESQDYADWGDFTINLDIENQKADLQANRESKNHLDVSPYLSGGSLQVRFVSWNSSTYELELEFELTNPTAFDVSDVRLIFTDFVWPVHPQYLLEHDSWTTALTGQVRPFMAFKKSDPDRILYGHDSETLSVGMYWPPGSPFMLNFKVTAWLGLHCNDVYEINNMHQSGHLFKYSGDSTLFCDVLDWQGDVSNVRMQDNFFDPGIHEMTHLGGSTWYYNLENLEERGPGTYQIWFQALSPNSQAYQTWNSMYVTVDPYGWYKSLNYSHTGTPGSHDIGCHPYDGYDKVSIIRSKGNGSSWVSESSHIMTTATDLVDLQDLDPNYRDFQPWPTVRIDAANDGAFGWTNNNMVLWYSFYAGMDTFCMMKDSMVFDYEPQTSDNRIMWYQSGTENPIAPIEVCDTFDGQLGCLFGWNGAIPLGVIAMYEGPLNGRHSYTDSDIRGFNSIPPSFIGTDDGQIDFADVGGIDLMPTHNPDAWYLFVSQKEGRKIEVFIFDTNQTVVTHHSTKHIVIGNELRPLDIEMLPSNGGYQPAPFKYILNVLVDASEMGGYQGGVIVQYDATTFDLIGTIGTASVPACPFPPRYMDTDDESYSIVISQEPSTGSMILTQWTYYEAP